jgi:hypothetical protein
MTTAQTAPAVDAYRAVQAINATAIKAGARSMKHMHHALTVGREPSPAMAWGTLVHEFALGTPEYVVYPGIRRGKEWEAFQAANQGVRIIIESERKALLDEAGLVRSLLDHPDAGPLIHGADMETPIHWEEPGIGPCKALPDAFNDDHLSDLKTCQSIAERDFSAASWRMGYHLQMAWYRRGCLAVGRMVESVNIIAVESSAPFDVAVFRVDPLLLEWADAECIRIALRYIECRDAGAFPGQHAGPQVLLQPQWADEQIQSQFDGESMDPSAL